MRPGISWQALHASTIGASHLRAGTECQDAVRVVTDPSTGEAVGLAVSDGHGSLPALRSAQGARIAVDIAADVMAAALNASRGGATVAFARWWGCGLARELERRWKDAVDRHLASEPLTSAERDAIAADRGPKALRRLEATPYPLYGATILGALAGPDYLALFKLGDGDVVLVDADGAACEPVHRDERLCGNETTSLCMPESWAAVETAFFTMDRKPPVAVLVSTDGWRNAYATDEGFLAVGPDIVRAVEERGLGPVREAMRDWVRTATESGSADDVTLAVLVRADRVATRPASTDTRPPATDAGTDAGATDPTPGTTDPTPTTCEECA